MELTDAERTKRLLHDLGERVKELTTLYGTAAILRDEERTLKEWMEAIAALLPPGWQYPEVTEARVSVGDVEGKTAGFRRTAWVQRAAFTTAEGETGKIEVAYTGLRPDMPGGEGPFLVEERKLIDALAEMLRTAVNRRTAWEKLRESNERIRELAGKLIAAQETERGRIARELHDDMNQRLAAVSLGLSALKRRVGPELTDAVAKLQKETTDLAQEIRGMSHRLHPSVLRHVGLASALGALCEEMGRGEGVPRMTFSAEGTLPEVPEDVSLCLYRVAQESLRNTVKHAGASAARVVLEGRGSAVALRISDDGRGFDAASAERAGGMGLLSMRERVKLAGGTISIESRPGAGTDLLVEVGAVADAAGGAA